MAKFTNTLLTSFLISVVSIKTVASISCYQCSGTDSDNPFECNEFLESDVSLLPVDCATIHDAKYCIKHVGRYEGLAIDCFQCNSSSTMECGDGLINFDGGILNPTSCGHVYNAMYCIKKTGGVGTKRFCSALDLGNYCNYVKQPGDKLNYRSCIFTCNSDGCNSSSTFTLSSTLLMMPLIIFTLCYFQS